MRSPRCLSAMKRRCSAAVFAWLLLVGNGSAAPSPELPGEAPAILAAHLVPIWTSPLTRNSAKPNPWPTTGFVPGAWAEAPSGALVLLGTMYYPGHAERLLLRNAERLGPETAIPLVLPLSEPPGLQRLPGLFFGHIAPNLDRAIDSIKVGNDSTVWLGGGIDFSMDIGSGRHADAYLARLDAMGQTIWQQAYSDGRALGISSIALISTGGAIVAGGAFGTYVDKSWVARIGLDGTRLQEWRLGNNKGIRVLPMQDGRTLIAGLADGGVASDAEAYRDAAQVAVKAGTYRDDVVVWSLDETGHLQGPVSVREGISRDDAYRGPGGGSGNIAVAAAGNAAYVASNWLDFLRPAGVEVAHVGPDGTVRWRQRLPETVASIDERRTFSCSPSIAAMPNGDALVACALNGQVQLHRLDGRTGKRRFASLASPGCQRGGYSSSASVLVQRDGKLFVLGSGFGNGADAGCSWMAQLTFDNE